MYRVVVVLLMCILASSSLYAAPTADIAIYVETNGLITVFGDTDHEPLQGITDSQDYTSKEGKYWILNLTTDQVFDTFKYQLYLPENSNINYLKTTPSLNIEEDEGRVKLIGTGENREMNIIVQYSIDSYFEEEKKNYFVYVAGAVIVIFLLGLLFLIIDSIFSKKRPKKQPSNKPPRDPSLLPPRQQEILKYLMQRNKMTQKELEEKMNIPKSSVSRNVKTLEVKGYIGKERIGQVNYLFLKKE